MNIKLNVNSLTFVIRQSLLQSLKKDRERWHLCLYEVSERTEQETTRKLRIWKLCRQKNNDVALIVMKECCT